MQLSVVTVVNSRHSRVLYLLCFVYDCQTWPVKKDNYVTLLHAEMRMCEKWMSGEKLNDKLFCMELKQQLGIEQH